MKTLDELIKGRRSIRKYLDEPVEKEKIEAILEAARLSPSACNAQPWRIIAVTDKKIIELLRKGGLGGVVVPNNWAKSAPAVLVVCAETNFLTHAIGSGIKNVQWHLIDIGICMEHMALKAVELGLGSCYIGWFNEKELRKILDIPKSWKVECLLTLGYPAEIPDPTPRKSINEISRIR